MLSSLVTVLASGILALATMAIPGAEAPVSTEAPVAAEVYVPEMFNFVGANAEENIRLNAAIGCSPRSVVNSVPALRACVIAGKIPGCEYDWDVDDIEILPDGTRRYEIEIYNDCPGPDVYIAKVFVVNCTVESWVCL